MRTTFAESLNLAEAGQWHEAWAMAQQDDGLLPGVTFQQWKEHAERCLHERTLEREARAKEHMLLSR